MSENFGDFLKKIRIEHGYKTQKQLSEWSGVSQTTLSRIEAGIQKPLPETLRLLATYLRPYTYGELMDKAGYFDGMSSSDKREVIAFFDNNEELNEQLEVHIRKMTVGDQLRPEAIRGLELELAPMLGAEDINFEYTVKDLRQLLLHEIDDVNFKNSILQAFIRIETLAEAEKTLAPQNDVIHHDNEDWTDAEMEDIELFKEFLRMKRRKNS